MALSVERRTSNREITGSTPAVAQQPLGDLEVTYLLGQVVCTYVPLLSSCRSWYRSKNREGNGRLCKRCGLLSITLSVSSLPT